MLQCLKFKGDRARIYFFTLNKKPGPGIVRTQHVFQFRTLQKSTDFISNFVYLSGLSAQNKMKRT